MGLLSWKTCDTGKVINSADSIKGALPCKVLIPVEFQSEFDNQKFIFENCYLGYGDFGGYNIYGLVAKWNREYLANHPEYVIPHSKQKISQFIWYQFYANLSLTEVEVVKKVRENTYPYFLWHKIGIEIASCDEDNKSLPYPIKISENEEVYENAKPSQENIY